VTKQPIEQMTLPSVQDVNEQRVLKFKERITAAVQSGDGKIFQPVLEQLEREQNIPISEIAAALASLLQGQSPFLLPQKTAAQEAAGSWGRGEATESRKPRREREERSERGPREERVAPEAAAAQTESEEGSTRASATSDEAREDRPPRERREKRGVEDGPPKETYRLEVGHAHGVLPGNIVGAIANEAGLDGKHIGHIDIRDDHTFVDLPEGMPKEIFHELKKVKIRGTEIRITRVDSKPPRPERTGHSVRPQREERRPRPSGGGGKPGGFKPGGFKPGGFKAHGMHAGKHRGPPKAARGRDS
jgi:ATP-dependent RNA helicase DeaD